MATMHLRWVSTLCFDVQNLPIPGSLGPVCTQSSSSLRWPAWSALTWTRARLPIDVRVCPFVPCAFERLDQALRQYHWRPSQSLPSPVIAADHQSVWYHYPAWIVETPKRPSILLPQGRTLTIHSSPCLQKMSKRYEPTSVEFKWGFWCWLSRIKSFINKHSRVNHMADNFHG